jgi:hypothetical protein
VQRFISTCRHPRMPLLPLLPSRLGPLSAQQLSHAVLLQVYTWSRCTLQVHGSPDVM